MGVETVYHTIAEKKTSTFSRRSPVRRNLNSPVRRAVFVVDKVPVMHYNSLCVEMERGISI